MKNYVPQLFDFIHQSPTSAHAVHAACQMLNQAGFTRLQESQPWRLEPGGKYYLTRGLTSVMAFRYPSAAFRGFSIVASHSDSPSFRIKGQPETAPFGGGPPGGAHRGRHADNPYRCGQGFVSHPQPGHTSEPRRQQRQKAGCPEGHPAPVGRQRGRFAGPGGRGFGR